MRAQRWLDLVPRIVPQEIDDLDDLTRGYDARVGEPGTTSFRDQPGSALPERIHAAGTVSCGAARVRDACRRS